MTDINNLPPLTEKQCKSLNDISLNLLADALQYYTHAMMFDEPHPPARYHYRTQGGYAGLYIRLEGWEPLDVIASNSDIQEHLKKVINAGPNAIKEEISKTLDIMESRGELDEPSEEELQYIEDALNELNGD